VDAAGEPLAEGVDLDALRADVAEQLRDALRSAGHPMERLDLHDFAMEDIPPRIALQGATAGTGYPALVDEGDSVALRVLASADEQATSMWSGTRRLLLLGLPSQARAIRHLVDTPLRNALATIDLGSAADWYHDCAAAAVDDLVERAGGPAWNRPAWERLRDSVSAEFTESTVSVAQSSRAVLLAANRVLARVRGNPAEHLAPSHADVQGQIGRLLYPGFATSVGAERLADLRRYLQAIEARLDTAETHWRRDHERMIGVLALEREHDRLAALLPGHPALENLGWMLQELRVAVFAQQVGARGPVSEKRVRRALDEALTGG
jgi:ATP-dependent helicase HrpA